MVLAVAVIADGNLRDFQVLGLGRLPAAPFSLLGPINCFRKMSLAERGTDENPVTQYDL
jgi:hypothetical protein